MKIDLTFNEKCPLTNIKIYGTEDTGTTINSSDGETITHAQPPLSGVQEIDLVTMTAVVPKRKDDGRYIIENDQFVMHTVDVAYIVISKKLPNELNTNTEETQVESSYIYVGKDPHIKGET